MALPTITPRTLITRLAEYINELVPFLSGTSGGQILYGGTDSGDDLELHSTSHATKGDIILGGLLTVDSTNDTVTISDLSNHAILELTSVSPSNGRLVFDNGTTIYSLRQTSSGLIYRDDTNSKTIIAILDGSNNRAFRIEPTTITLNEDGVDQDFRVESDNNTHMLFVDAGNDNIGINESSPDASALLHLTSTTKGFLPPILTTTERNAISSPAEGLIIYNSTDNKHQGYDGSSWNDFY